MTKDQEFIINIVADVVRQRSYYLDERGKCDGRK